MGDVPTRVLLAAALCLVALVGLAVPAGAQIPGPVPPAPVQPVPPAPLQPVPTDLSRYVGEWDQLAAIPAI